MTKEFKEASVRKEFKYYSDFLCNKTLLLKILDK